MTQVITYTGAAVAVLMMGGFLWLGASTARGGLATQYGES